MKELQIIQEKLNAPKTLRNNFWNYNYRSAETILEAVKPLLKETETILKLSDELVLIWERYYIKSTVTLKNKDGQIEESIWFAREEETKKWMDGSQITWASSSYARKYALNWLFAIDDEKDSDATNTHWKKEETEDKPWMDNIAFSNLEKNIWNFKNWEEAIKTARAKYKVSNAFAEKIKNLFK